MAELERVYNIPLRKEWAKVPRYKRAKKAVKAVREFLVRHMKVYDRDLDKVKVGRWLNMHIWQRGIKKPPSIVKVKATKDGEIVKVELVELPKKAKKEEERKAKEKAEAEKKKKDTESVKLKLPFAGKKKEEKEKKAEEKPAEAKEEPAESKEATKSEDTKEKIEARSETKEVKK